MDETDEAAGAAPLVLSFESFPDATLHLMLFTDVQNAAEIRAMVVAGEIQPECAFINAGMVPDIFPLRVSALRALSADSRAALVSRSLHAELVYNLSGSKHIADSLKRFGVADGVKTLLVARFNAKPGEVVCAAGLVKGKQVSVSLLPSFADHVAIAKVYKLAQAELVVGTEVDAIVARIAARDCA